jgi:hypothetical protein
MSSTDNIDDIFLADERPCERVLLSCDCKRKKARQSIIQTGYTNLVLLEYEMLL